MKLRRFVGPSMPAALECVRAALGPDAMILETRTLTGPEKGVEVTAAADADPAPTAAAGQGDAALAAEVRQLSGLVRALVGRAWTGRTPTGGPELAELYGSLLAQGVDGGIAASLIEETATRVGGGVALEGAVAAAVGGAVMFGFENESDTMESPVRGRPRVRLFCGPPGDGKTTTIAKLAGRMMLQGAGGSRANGAGASRDTGVRRLALVSTDTYRIGGREELAAYGRILGIPLATASSAAELRGIVERLHDVDEVLVDTAGLTLRDEAQRRELQALADAVEGTCRTLVISATAAPAVTRRVWAAMDSLRPDSCVVTKVDEAPVVGALDALWRQELPIAFFGTGRRIPHDLEVASPERMAAWLMAA
jgi:flagellar biosynthesis protein FlhF